MTLQEELAEAEARVDAIKAQMVAASCREAGCDMKFVGGRNAGCEVGRACTCSVSVHVCWRCGDSDYGDNAEADEIRRKCAERRA